MNAHTGAFNAVGGPSQTLFDRLWQQHEVVRLDDGRSLIHIDRHLLHDLSSPQAFAGLRRAGRAVRNPERCYAMSDHIVATHAGRGDDTVEGGREMLLALRENARRHGIRHFDLDDPRNGIVHVVAPELGLVLPGMTVVCGDSHTCTLGALGAWAWGVGTSDVEHVLATQVLAMHRPAAMHLRLAGRLAPGLDAKDLALFVIRRIGVQGAGGGVMELCGPVVEALTMEQRFTLCNMGIEAGARAAMIAPDDTTLAWLRERCGEGFVDAGAVRDWMSLRGDPDARYDTEREEDICALTAPQLTWGTTPAQAAGVDEPLPDPDSAASDSLRAGLRRAYDYMDLQPGMRLRGLPVDRVFIGSCTNGRLSDLIAAARLLRGRRVAPGVQALVVPGSRSVSRAACELGLDRVFREAGCDWREPGCSMCVGMNADRVLPGERCVSTSNRNFEGRQGPGARTHLASPATAAACAVAGRIVDHRELAD